MSASRQSASAVVGAVSHRLAQRLGESSMPAELGVAARDAQQRVDEVDLETQSALEGRHRLGVVAASPYRLPSAVHASEWLWSRSMQARKASPASE
nr:hypothetical protein [Deltaproteobacteria bacterium]